MEDSDASSFRLSVKNKQKQTAGSRDNCAFALVMFVKFFLCPWAQLGLVVIIGQNYTTEQCAVTWIGPPKACCIEVTWGFFPWRVWEQRSSVPQHHLPVFSSCSFFWHTNHKRLHTDKNLFSTNANAIQYRQYKIADIKYRYMVLFISMCIYKDLNVVLWHNNNFPNKRVLVSSCILLVLCFDSGRFTSLSLTSQA